MARYRKIDPRIWNDEKFRTLSDDGKLVFLFLLTHPHMTALGAMRATLLGLGTELGWTFKRFSEGFREPFRKGLLRVDEKASFVAATNFLRYNLPDNPNVVKSWSSSLDLVPECEEKSLLVERVKRVIETLPKGFAEALPEPFRKGLAKGMPKQEQEQEQEQEKEKESRACAKLPESGNSPLSGIDDTVFLEFPVVAKDRKLWPLTDSKVREYQQTYSDLDVPTVLRKALQWCRDNSTKRKTPKGMPAFLNRWLSTAQDDGAHRNNGHGPRGKQGTIGELEEITRWAE